MIHPTAIIEHGAELGVDVTVGPLSYISTDIRIGDRCVIGPHVTIHKHTTIGDDCRVHAGAVLGDVPQDVDFNDGVESEVIIGSSCLVREGVTIHRGSKPGTVTRVGDGCFLMAFSHFAHNVRLGNNVIVANGVLLGGYVQIDDRAFLSGNCIVHQFVKIGRLAMLGGGCAASKDIPPFCTMRPVALNTVAGLNVVGMRRAGIKPGDRTNIKKAFKILYRSELNVSQATDRIEQTFDSGPALEFCSFIRESERGICGMDNNAQT